MAKYIIEGGKPLKGQVRVLGAKNSGFKLLIAALLSDQKSIISNIANNTNIAWVSEAIAILGGNTRIIDNHSIEVSGKGISATSLEGENSVSRASSMFIPILLHRFGKAEVPMPSGDKIGERPIDMHIKGLEAMGVVINESKSGVEAKIAGRLKGTTYKFEKNTHTGTDTIILAACLADGTTLLENAAAEPEVDDLINFLTKMGAQIKRLGSRTIEIKGVSGLNGANHAVMPDRGEVVTFGCAALATGGDVSVSTEVKVEMIPFTTEVLKAGGGVEEKGANVRYYSKGGLKATDIQTLPHPGFLTDWQPLWATLMTQAKGVSTIHETIHESRFSYTENLKKMGANIEFFDPRIKNPEDIYNFHWTAEAASEPHAVKITGPTPLKGQELTVTDIRAGATLVLAALTAEGTTILSDVEHIERGHEKLEERLEKLGARIKKVD